MAAPDPDDDTRAQAEALLADLLGRSLAQAQAATRQHTDPLTRADLDAALANLVTKDDLAQAVAALATKDSVRADVAEANNSLLKWAFGTRPRDRHPRRRRSAPPRIGLRMVRLAGAAGGGRKAGVEWEQVAFDKGQPAGATRTRKTNASADAAAAVIRARVFRASRALAVEVGGERGLAVGVRRPRRGKAQAAIGPGVAIRGRGARLRFQVSVAGRGRSGCLRGRSMR